MRIGIYSRKLQGEFFRRFINIIIENRNVQRPCTIFNLVQFGKKKLMKHEHNTYNLADFSYKTGRPIIATIHACRELTKPHAGRSVNFIFTEPS